jgi:hypothetical protein
MLLVLSVITLMSCENKTKLEIQSQTSDRVIKCDDGVILITDKCVVITKDSFYVSDRLLKTMVTRVILLDNHTDKMRCKDTLK